jgi:hypothetical protein
VTTAISTIMANTVGDITLRSRPMFKTISSIKPRVFIKTPRPAASRRPRPRGPLSR